MPATAEDFAATIWRALDGDAARLGQVAFTGEGSLPSSFAVTDFAAGSIAAAGLAVAEIVQAATGLMPALSVDRRLASFWFGLSIRPIGWSLPSPWDPIAGDYEASDGWIRLHTNAPHHRAAAERVLGRHGDKAAMGRAVAAWDKGRLEAAIIAEGGCGAEMRSLAEWAAHPQGQAVASEALVAETRAPAPSADWKPDPARPLSGLRVLDLTRVLAGPVASRFLAAYGADVLRIDPPDWDEPAIVPEVTPGKRCARLDLKHPAGRSAFETFLQTADVLVHGYRPDALDRLGFGAASRQAMAPGLIDVALDAYGWTGPWAARRGFDSLVQMSSGIAHEGMVRQGASVPMPLPVQAVDHAAGYLLAATIIRAVRRRLIEGERTTARLSLARTATLLVAAGPQPDGAPLRLETSEDLESEIETTAWGPARRLKPPLTIAGVPMRMLPARPLGSDRPAWA